MLILSRWRATARSSPNDPLGCAAVPVLNHRRPEPGSIGPQGTQGFPHGPGCAGTRRSHRARRGGSSPASRAVPCRLMHRAPHGGSLPHGVIEFGARLGFTNAQALALGDQPRRPGMRGRRPQGPDRTRIRRRPAGRGRQPRRGPARHPPPHGHLPGRTPLRHRPSIPALTRRPARPSGTNSPAGNPWQLGLCVASLGQFPSGVTAANPESRSRTSPTLSLQSGGGGLLGIAHAGQQVRAGRAPLAGASAVVALSCCMWPLRPEAKFLASHGGLILRLTWWDCPPTSADVRSGTRRSSLS
jgi:hypothetical protein